MLDTLLPCLAAERMDGQSRAGNGFVLVLKARACMPAFGARCKANKTLGLLKTSLWISMAFFLPTVQAAPCSPPQPTATHYTQLVFILISALKENYLLCSCFFENCFFLWPRTSGWCHSPFPSFLFLLASSPGLPAALPLLGWEVLRLDTQLQQPPAPAADKCQSCA